jgi:MFS family permease
MMKLAGAFRNPWWVVFGATLGMVVGNTPITLFTFGLFLKPVTTEFGWRRSTFAGAIFVSQAVGAVSMPLIGRLIDRWGIRRVTLTFIVLFSLATVLLSQTRSSGPFFVLYGICGLAGSGRGPIAYAKAISAWFEARRGLALGIAMTGLGIGTALVPQVARLLIDDFGWRGAYVGLGIIAFAVSFPAVALFIHEPTDAVTDEVTSSVDQESHVQGLHIVSRELLMKSTRFWFLTVSIFLVSASLNGPFTHIVPLLTDRGISIRLATSIISFSSLALMSGQITSGYLLDRFFATYVAGFFFLLSCFSRGHHSAQYWSGRNRAAFGWDVSRVRYRSREQPGGILGQSAFRAAQVQ